MKCNICGADPMTANCNNANCDTGNQTQDDLYKHLTDPETIKQAAEGSMKKRQALIDRVSNTTDAELNEILTVAFNDFYDYMTEKDIIKVAHEYSEKTIYKTAKANLKALILRERVDELKRMWNATQPDIVPEGWHPETEEGKYLQKRIKELKSS